MTTVGSPRMRWVSLLGLFMLLMSVTPTGLAAQVGLTPTGDVAQEEGAPMGQAIELLVVDCPPGTPDNPSSQTPGCQDGRAGLNIQVTSTNPALGIDQGKVSVKPSNPGPGVINTGEIPLGEYRLAIDLPTEGNRFFFECQQRGTGIDVPTSAAPDGAPNAFVVENSAEVDIVCRAFVMGEGADPTMEITYRECDRSDFPNDNRSFEDLQANCTNISTDPPTLNVRHLSEAGQPITEHQQDAQGVVDLTLAPGDFDMFTDLDMDQWGEYLFCEFEGQPRYQKDFDPDRGITTFVNLLHGEEFTCDWFGVSATDVVAGQPEQQESENPDAPAEGLPEVIDPQGDDQQIAQTQDPVDPTFNITYNECTRGDLTGDDRSYQHLNENCIYFSEPGPTFTILEGDGSLTTENLDVNGELNFSHSTEPFTIYTGLPLEEWGEYLFCEYEGQELYPKPFSVDGLNGFSDLQAGEEFECSWFAVKASETPTDGEEPPVVDPPVDEPTNASIGITMLSCESEEAVGDTASIDAFRINCDVPTGNVVLTLADERDALNAAVTNQGGVTAFEDIPAGDFRVWSEIPLEAATEYYFCAEDDGQFSAVPLSDRGVASFPDVDGQQIDCEIYVVPENLRGEITGSSVEVHLSLCPANYDGSAWYGDCHDEGIGELPFTILGLTGPGVEVTADTVVERTPGPGIVRFTALPAGDYVLAGGPPQDFGSVFLYCSDPANNTEVETTFEGGMGYFTLAEEQSIVCDWYFVPDDQGVEPTPTPEPTRAEIFTTMFICPPDVNVAGSSFSELDNQCAERLSDVPMTLQSPGGVPITANTGASGEGALRFYDLTGGDYVLTPNLPAGFLSAAVYCDLDGGDVYQKALSNGATTFVDVDGELISCSWFVTAKPQPAPGPTGSITIREMLCEGDRSSIVDWERECQPGTSGVSFTITSSGGGVNQTLTPNAEGVAVFTGLPNEYYDVQQSEGAWCRAKAERVDSQSRVIVSGGGNTDVFLYQCNQDLTLPETGAGPLASGTAMPKADSIMLGAAALPLFAMAAWQIRRWHMASVVSEPVDVHEALTRTEDGYRYR